MTLTRHEYRVDYRGLYEGGRNPSDLYIGY